MSSVFVRKMNVGLGVALLMLLLNAVISYRNILKLIHNERSVSQSHQTIAELEAALSLLKDAETGQRGYLLTGKDRYLEPYNASVSQINQQIQFLRQLKASPTQQQQIQALEQVISLKLAELDQTIQVRRTQGLTPALQIVQSDRGKQLMDSVRQQITTIEQQEKQQLQQRIGETQQSLSSTLLTFTLVTATSLLLLALVAVALWRNETQRQQAEQVLKEREERLRLFVKYAPVSVAMFDRTMRYLTVSQRWVEDYHLGSIASILGKSHYDVFPNIPERWRQAHQQGLAGQREKCENDRFVLPDGSEQYLRWEIQPWFDGGSTVSGILIFVEDITARKTTETALQESEQKFKATFNQAAVGIAHVAPDGSWLQVNQKLCQIVGYTEAELLERTFQDITHPDDLNKDLSYVQQMLAGGIQTYAMEKRYICKNSSLIWINLTVSLVQELEGQPKYFISVIEDISDRKLAEADLQQYKDIFQFAEHGLAISRGAILERVNPTFARLHGYTVEELAGRPILDTFPPEIHKETIQFIQQLDRVGHLTYETIHARKDGSSFPVLLDITVVQDEPTPYRIVNLFDITERKKAEEALRRSYLNLEQRVAERTVQLQETNQELEAFTYSVSHDLRAPLRIMQGFAQALQEDYETQLDDIARSYIQSIAESAVQMDQLINDLLNYSRLSRTQINLSPTDLNHVVEVALQQLQAEMRERQAIVTVEPNLPSVMAHRSTLIQVITNLISNAIKFVDPSVQPQVSVFAQTDQNQVHLWVVDNGIGIALEHQKRIFRVFERLHGVEIYPGTGIGLAIVQKGIERMGGQVGVKSESDSGSRFWIALPLARSNP